jgi:hypothetical protein
MGFQSCVLSKLESDKKSEWEIILQKHKMKILLGFEPRMCVLITKLKYSRPLQKNHILHVNIGYFKLINVEKAIQKADKINTMY